MKNKYIISEVIICPFEFMRNGLVRPMLNEYPIHRLCVIDADKKIAIDVCHEFKYDYLETCSMLYLINGASSKIREGRRAAIQPIANPNLRNIDRLKVELIIKKLDNDDEFIDGNKVLSNEDYLKLSIQEESEGLKMTLDEFISLTHESTPIKKCKIIKFPGNN